MRLDPEDIQRSIDGKPLEMFAQGIKADRTRYVYTCKLRQILCEYMKEVLSGTFEERAAELLGKGREDPVWTRGLMLELARKLRERTALGKDDPQYMSPTSINTNFAPLQKLFDTNDVAVPWKRIRSTFPEAETYDTRGWTRGEIRKILRHARGAIDRAIILIMASSGVRIGGMELKWEHIVPIYDEGGRLREGVSVLEEDTSGAVACAKLRVYANTFAEYAAFITPEAYEAVQDYQTVWAREAGREPEPGEPFLKKAGPSIIGLTHDGIRQRAYKAIWNAGMRGSHLKEGMRYNVPGMNGFRRFCNKTLKDAVSDDSPISSLIKKERMLGHTGIIKLDRSYYKISPLEMAKEYLSAVPSLTIYATWDELPVDGQEDTSIGGPGTKPDQTPDGHGTTTSNTGSTAITPDSPCPNCGRATGDHKEEEYKACIAKVTKKALSGQPNPGA